MLVDYIFSIALSVIVFVSVVAVAYSFYRQQLSVEASNELRQVALQISDAVLKTYNAAKQSTVSPTNGTVTVLSQTQLDLPSKVAQRNYKVTLQATTSEIPVISSILEDGKNITFVKQASGITIVAQTTEDPVISQKIILPNINAFVQGVFHNSGNATLTYYRYNFNGTIYDSVSLGDSNLILQITSVS